MTPGRRQLFIYWRTAAADARAALQTVRSLQSELRRLHPGLHCALYLRHDPAADDATLMETYALDAALAVAGVDPALQQAIESMVGAALAPWQRGTRHVEVFDAIDG